MRYVTIALCVLMPACATEVPSAPTSLTATVGGAVVMEAQGGSELPLRGNLQATETVAGPLHTLTATGTATHLGRFTLTSQFTVTNFMASGTAIWEAANGDQLFTTVTGQAALAPPVLNLLETHTITGGTGRFSGASGSVTITRVLNPQTLASSASFEGTLTLAH